MKNIANKPKSLSGEQKAESNANNEGTASNVVKKAIKSRPRQSKVQNTTDETKMEVYHHPQLDHKSKPWKEYLLEGFMIFIAVMMGFIAENIREDITNDQHVKQLTTRLMQDLKADTANLNIIYKHEARILKSNDTLFVILQQPLNKVNAINLQRLAADSHSLWLFHPSAGAIGAIKNELHLKQFSNSDIIGHIANYEKHIELLHTVQDITLQYQRNFLDPFLYQHFTPADLDAAFNHSVIADEKMRNLSQDNLTQLAAQMVLIRINNKELINDNRMLEKDATELLQYITRRYDL